jgi:hypothetical protein
MSINLGLYDFFAYIVPGCVYLFIFNELLKLTHSAYVDISRIENAGQILILGILAFIAGHVMDYISYYLWTRFWGRRKPDDALKFLRERHTSQHIQFEKEDWRILSAAIRLYDTNLYSEIQKSNVESVMLRNLSFSFLLLALLQLVTCLLNPAWQYNLLGIPMALLFSIVCILRAERINGRYYILIYETAFCFGNDLEMVLEKFRGKENPKPAKKNKQLTKEQDL